MFCLRERILTVGTCPPEDKPEVDMISGNANQTTRMGPKAPLCITLDGTAVVNSSGHNPEVARKIPQPLTIECNISDPRTPPRLPAIQLPALTVQTPAPFPYRSDSAVPWRYDVEVVAPSSTQTISNIAGVGGMTRSGRCYTPEELEKKRESQGK